MLDPGDLAPQQGTQTAVPIGFRKQNASSEVSWRITPKVTAEVGYDWEGWQRAHREVKSTNEQTARGAFDVRPVRWLLGRLSLSHGVRTFGAGSYTSIGENATAFGGAGLPQFRKFDEADRTRDKADVFLQATPIDAVELSGSFFGQQDNYFDTEFGLQESEAYGWSLDASWAPLARLNLFAGYAHDEYQSTQQNCPIVGAGMCDADAGVFARPRDILDTVHSGINLIVIPERMDLGLGYRFNFGRSKIGSNTSDGGDLAQTPDITNSFHGIDVLGRYRLSKHWVVQVNYLYEKYLENDFTTDGITPSLANVAFDGFQTGSAADVRSVLLPLEHPNAAIHFVAFSLGYHF